MCPTIADGLHRRFQVLFEGYAEISASVSSIVVLRRCFDPTFARFTIDFIGRLCDEVRARTNG